MENLKHKLQSRHIQFIALGGIIGTGLFLGAGSSISAAGPSVILAYLLIGIIAFLIMRQLGEMSTNEPSAGSSSHFACTYWGKFPGFLAGWNYWAEYALSGIAELTAVAAYTQYWFPDIATWKIALFFFVLVNAINLITVKTFGEVELWFSSVKVIAVCAIILAGGYILFFDPNLITGASIKNLWCAATVGPHAGDKMFSGIFPHGFVGFVLTFPMIIFAFDGLELIGLAAAEAENPEKTIPKAVNQVMFLILFLYIGTFVVLLSLCHWSNLNTSDNLFVMVFDKLGFKYAAWMLNFVVLTAALSVYNSCIYSNSRMLYGLALQKNAPQIFAKTNKRGIPTAAIFLSGVLTSLVVPLNYFFPNWMNAFEVIVSFSVIGSIINWGIIPIAHLKFRKHKKLNHHKTLFPSPFYPYSNYITIAFLASIPLVMALPQFGMTKLAVAMPVWILVIYIWYKISKGVKA
ncbi:MAG: amino acid permease [Endomicrobium sp.]|uniref:amino acid permease n=1 Tax=Candidatus Endomicrobiellum pyrsonymphae TaxID=1408203 RepID=UPI00358C937B|nr:amino acid permease [Endomicrobium sp.]